MDSEVVLLPTDLPHEIWIVIGGFLPVEDIAAFFATTSTIHA
jgi:hypothetical protein